MLLLHAGNGKTAQEQVGRIKMVTVGKFQKTGLKHLKLTAGIVSLIVNTLFLQNWGFYELIFLGTDHLSLNKCPLSLRNGPLSFKNGLLGRLRLGAEGVGTFLRFET